ncbi:MAG: FMN-binding protein [Salinivirgaceae bacterium]|nr:FMN-binding protein [Salinivirgaceae bacterium]
MKKYIISIVLILISIGAIANELNYYHKQLNKELLKTWEVDCSNMFELMQLSEMTINEGKFFKVEKNDSILGYVYVGRIRSCRAGGCSIDKSKPFDGAYEYFDAFILFNPQKSIEKVKVYSYQATHGHEVCSRGWLKQFIGFESKKPLEVGKNIDGISGATISVYALTDEVNYISQLLQKI